MRRYRLDGHFRDRRGPRKWPMGRDGRLYLDGTNLQLPAGSIKDYSSITIINGGLLEIVGPSILGFGTNDGTAPTIIGCSGNCTINSGGAIEVVQNGLGPADNNPGTTYTKQPPSGATTGAVSITCKSNSGGGGGTSAFSGSGGVDSEQWGHGGGGAGVTTGDNTYDDVGWGQSGVGADSGVAAGVAPSRGPYYNGFSANGVPGSGGEVGSGESVGGGGSGAVRGYAGGCLYLHVDGILNVPSATVVIFAQGSAGGGGGDGGYADTPDADAYGGGAGGGGAGGNGGNIIVRYKSGAFATDNVNVDPGTGGGGGAGGGANGLTSSTGGAGSDGSDGDTGTVDIKRIA